MTAFYLRVSKSDQEEEGNSIEAQRELLWQNLKKYDLSKEEVKEYIDNGYSGKNFERPGIKSLFADIKNGSVKTVLVKDFSRFGRNYNEVSNYLENLFPKFGIRFIAVNNRYDSKEDRDFCSALFNLSDDYYSEENSEKIKQVLLQMKKTGKFIAPVAPYGYQKDKEQPYHLMIDPKAAEIVKLIFQMRCDGKSGAEIARYLNGKEIPSPRDYQNKKQGEHIWQSEVIWSIIRNREYLGNLVAGKYSTIQTGSRKRKLILPKDRIEIEMVHEAIVDKETFEKAQQKENRIEKKEKIAKKSQSCLQGKVLCKGCGHKMKRKGQKNPFFFCKYYYDNYNPLCLKSGIKEKLLLELIGQVLVQEVGISKIEGFYEQYENQYQNMLRQKEAKERKRKDKINFERYLLYEKWKEHVIPWETYQWKIKLLEEKEDGREIEENAKEKKELFFNGLFQKIIKEIKVDNNRNIQIQFWIRKG